MTPTLADLSDRRCSAAFVSSFASTHSAFHNLFNQERHLIGRDQFKARRSAALAEWQALAS